MPVQGEIIDLGISPRALIVKPSSLGDIIHSLPVLSAFKKRYPDSTVHWAVFKGLDGILDGHPLIDRLVVIDRKDFKSLLNLPFRLISLRNSLRQNSYDITIDLQGLFRSGLISYFSNAPVRAGFCDAREGSPFFYTHSVRGGTDVHAVDRYLKVADMLGCDKSQASFPMGADEVELPFSDDYAVLVPGARWNTKRWPVESFGSLASQLPVKSVVVGGKEDMELGEMITEMSHGKTLNMAGRTTLMQLSGIIRGAKFAVTNDTGPMHIAAAHGVKVFAIFGPTSPERTGPYGEGHVIITSEETCSPCYSRRCEDLKCMDSITPEMVLNSITANS